MKLSTVKKYRKRSRFFGSLLLKNPVLVMGLDLPFVIACSISLRNAVAMSIEMFLIHIVTVFASLFFVHRLPGWLRVIATVAVSTVMMMVSELIIYRLFSGISNSLGMYLYLMAVNSMTLMQAAGRRRREKPGRVLADAFMNAMGFAIAVLFISLLRELFGNGSIWGVSVPVPLTFSALLIPFAGFLLMAFVLAFFRFATKKLSAWRLLEQARRDSRYMKI